MKSSHIKHSVKVIEVGGTSVRQKWSNHFAGQESFFKWLVNRIDAGRCLHARNKLKKDVGFTGLSTAPKEDILQQVSI